MPTPPSIDPEQSNIKLWDDEIMGEMEYADHWQSMFESSFRVSCTLQGHLDRLMVPETYMQYHSFPLADGYIRLAARRLVATYNENEPHDIYHIVVNRLESNYDNLRGLRLTADHYLISPSNMSHSKQTSIRTFDFGAPFKFAKGQPPIIRQSASGNYQLLMQESELFVPKLINSSRSIDEFMLFQNDITILNADLAMMSKTTLEEVGE